MQSAGLQWKSIFGTASLIDLLHWLILSYGTCRNSYTVTSGLAKQVSTNLKASDIAAATLKDLHHG